MPRLAVVGVGVMGEAIVRGLLASGWKGDDLVVTDVIRQRRDEIAAALGVRVADDAADAASAARDGVLVCVKPPQAPAAFEDVGKAVSSSGAGIISIVAMVGTTRIAELAGEGVGVVRAMPNMPARIGKGVTALSAGAVAGESVKTLAAEVFSAVGPVVWVGEEHLDAVTALSGSGPAYVFLVAEAMVDAGVALGLPRDVAETLAFATIEGAGAILTQSGEHPAVLRSQVTTPGGTTAAALAVMEAMATRAAIIEGIRAAWQRSRSG